MLNRIPGPAARRNVFPHALALFAFALAMHGARSQDAQGFRVDIDSFRTPARADEALHFRCGAPRNETPYDIEVHSPVDVAQGLGKFAVNVTKEGAWIARHASFTAPDAFIADRHFGNTHLIGTVVGNGDSAYDVDLTSAGVITATQTGTTNKLVNVKFAYPLTGTATWRATETIDLHTGVAQWSFHADVDATYRTSAFSPTCPFTGTLDAHATSTRTIRMPPQVARK